MLNKKGWSITLMTFIFSFESSLFIVDTFLSTFLLLTDFSILTFYCYFFFRDNEYLWMRGRKEPFESFFKIQKSRNNPAFILLRASSLHTCKKNRNNITGLSTLRITSIHADSQKFVSCENMKLIVESHEFFNLVQILFCDWIVGILSSKCITNFKFI